MPFCPDCRSEFRAGFSVCAPCGDVPLVDELPELNELAPESVDQAVPVGLASQPDLARIVQLEGVSIDLLRVFPLSQTKEMQGVLSTAGFASLIVPVPVTFPDMTPRFELRVMPDDRDAAEAQLRRQWSDALDAEGLGGDALPSSVDECPACGAAVPLDVDTCPECELFVGRATEDEDEDEA